MMNQRKKVFVTIGELVISILVAGIVRIIASIIIPEAFYEFLIL